MKQFVQMMEKSNILILYYAGFYCMKIWILLITYDIIFKVKFLSKITFLAHLIEKHVNYFLILTRVFKRLDCVKGSIKYVVIAPGG